MSYEFLDAPCLDLIIFCTFPGVSRKIISNLSDNFLRVLRRCRFVPDNFLRVLVVRRFAPNNFLRVLKRFAPDNFIRVCSRLTRRSAPVAPFTRF